MAKQIYTGPPANARRYYTYTYEDDDKFDGWKYRDKKVHSTHPTYDFYTWVKSQNSVVVPPYIGKAATLWWNGSRWVVWVNGVFVGQNTDFQDINDPPMEWAESLYLLANA